jgi:hypothetical protein
MSFSARLKERFSKLLVPESPRKPDEPIVVKTFANRIEAEIAKSLLDANDIPAYIAAPDVGGTNPLLMVGDIGVRLFVRRDHAEKALRLMESQTSVSDSAGETPEDR